MPQEKKEKARIGVRGIDAKKQRLTDSVHTRIETERAGRLGGYVRMTFGTIDDVTDARAKGPHAEGGQARTKPPMSEPDRQGGTKRKERRDGG